MKKIEHEGIEAPFPRMVLVSDPTYWKPIMEARNLSAHTYDHELAEKLCADIIGIKQTH